MIRNGPPYIGSPILGGTSQSILYVDANGKIAQDNAGISFDPSTDRLTVAGAINLASAGVRLSGSAGVFTLAGLSGQQENLTFDLASTASTVAIASGSGVTSLTWTGSFTAGGILAGLGLATAYVTKTGDYTLTDSDDVVELITNAGTFTLPTAVGRAGRIFTVKNLQTANALTVQGTSGQTFDGAASVSVINGGFSFKSDNANWRIIADLGFAITPVDGGLIYSTASGVGVTATADGKWDSSLKNLGLGQATPLAQLHMTHAASGYSEFTDAISTSITPGFLLSDSIDAASFAGASATFRGAHYQVSSSPASNASRTVAAANFLTVVPASNSTALTSYTLQGSNQRADYIGTGTIGTIQAARIVGAVTGTGAVVGTALRAVDAQVTKGANATGAAPEMTAGFFTISNSSASGTVTDAFGLRVNAVTNAGTFTNTFGLYIGTLTGAGTHTNKPISIQTNDFNAWNYIKGLGSASTTTYGTQFLQDDATRGSHHYIATGNNPVLGSSATPRNQAFMGGYAQTDTGNDYFNYIFRGGAKNSDAGTPYKELFEMGVEGNYSDSSTLSNHHWYLWDFPASKLVLSYGYSAQEFTVSEVPLSIQTSLKLGTIGSSKLYISLTSPTISSGFGTSPSITHNNGTAVIRVNVGTGGTANGGVIGLPVAPTGWVLLCDNITAAAANRANERVVQTATTTNTATIQNQLVSTGAAQAFGASDIVRIHAYPY